MKRHLVTAVEMARAAGIEPKRFRQALRAEGLAWHRHSERWTVEVCSAEHRDMQSVLNGIRRASG